MGRYERSLANLPLAIAIPQRVYAFDNSLDGIEARLCAQTQDGKVRKVYGPLPEWVAAVIDPLPRHQELVDLRSQA